MPKSLSLMCLAGVLTIGLTSRSNVVTAQLVQTEESLGTVPDSVEERQIKLSPDGRRLAAIVPKRGQLKQSFFNSMTFGAWKRNPGRVLIDAQIGSEFDGICCLTFSSDGTRFAYVAMLPPGKEPEGKRPADKPKKAGPVQVVIDGEAGPLYHGAFPFGFAPHSQKLIYQIIGGDGSHVMVVDRVETNTLPGLAFEAVFSPDGDRLAVAAMKGERNAVLLDGNEIAIHSRAGFLAFSADGKRFAYARKEGEEWSVVVDGVPQAEFDWVFKPNFSPDGTHVAYWAQEEDEKVMVFDGKVVGRGAFLPKATRQSFSRALGPTFSPDSRTVGYTLNHGKDSILQIGEAHHRFTQALPFNLSFSKDGSRFAHGLYRDEDKRVVAVLNGVGLPGEIACATRWWLGVNGGFFGLVAPRFSPDGDHYVYLSSKNPKWKEGSPNLQVVIDGVASESFDRVLGISWESNDVAWAVIRRDDEYFRVEFEAPE